METSENSGGQIMTDINNPLATDSDAIRVAEIYERFNEHIKLHGEPTRNDTGLWNELIETMTPQTLLDCCILAHDHQDWHSDIHEWVEEVFERSPFYIRTKAERKKKCKNNLQIWHLLMMMREVIEAKLKDQEDPRNRLFEFQTS
jgi:hypothetical protein